MPEPPIPGAIIDGFRIGDCIHTGAQAWIYRIAEGVAEFSAVMKVPRLGPGEPAENLISFETEASILPALSGAHVPRVAATGDLAQLPYLVLEWVEGVTLESLLQRGGLPPEEVARLGAAIADAVHAIHQQDAIHFDLKPDNVVVKPDATVALIDFGLAHHMRFPDLLAEEKRFAAGSAPYVSPEQVLGRRSDKRSDIFSLGVILYEMTTGKLAFGSPRTLAGLRDRLWLDPIPPREHARGVLPWLQEIVLRCLEPRADDRYQSAAHVAFDLRNPEQVGLTARASKSGRTAFLSQARRWWRARREQLPLAIETATQARAAPVILVAVDTMHPEDPRQAPLRRVVLQILSVSADFRLICTSVIRAGPVTAGEDAAAGASDLHLEHRIRLRHWAEPLQLPRHRLSLHVIESLRAESALLDFAERNSVDLIVLGAPSPTQHALAWWRSVASGVTANARCSVFVVRIPEL